MYFRQSWKDPRLTFNQNDLPKQKQIRLGQNRYSGKDGVWVPDTFFRNEKKAQYHSITVDNKMMKLSADGSVWYVTKWVLTTISIVLVSRQSS